MTHFGVIVAMLVGVLTLLTAILGTIWRAATAWTTLKDAVRMIQDKLIDIIADYQKTDGDFEKRLRDLEHGRH